MLYLFWELKEKVSEGLNELGIHCCYFFSYTVEEHIEWKLKFFLTIVVPKKKKKSGGGEEKEGEITIIDVQSVLEIKAHKKHEPTNWHKQFYSKLNLFSYIRSPFCPFVFSFCPSFISIFPHPSWYIQS